MTRSSYVLLATLGSALLLIGAFGFQHLGGLAPCKMCLWQRWPHAAAILIGLIVLSGAPRAFIWLGALAVTITGGIGAYHAGVEWKWWPGPSSCSGGGMDLGGLSGTDLLSVEGPSGLVMCDEIVWQLFGLSMAGWNALICVALLGLWIAAARSRA